MRTIGSLRSTIFVDDPRAISLPGFAAGMILGYNEAERHQDKLPKLIDWAKRRFSMIIDDPNYTDYETNRTAGALSAYERALDLIQKNGGESQ